MVQHTDPWQPPSPCSSWSRVPGTASLPDESSSYREWSIFPRDGGTWGQGPAEGLGEVPGAPRAVGTRQESSAVLSAFLYSQLPEGRGNGYGTQRMRCWIKRSGLRHCHGSAAPSALGNQPQVPACSSSSASTVPTGFQACLCPPRCQQHPALPSAKELGASLRCVLTLVLPPEVAQATLIHGSSGTGHPSSHIQAPWSVAHTSCSHLGCGRSTGLHQVPSVGATAGLKTAVLSKGTSSTCTPNPHSPPNKHQLHRAQLGILSCPLGMLAKQQAGRERGRLQPMET